MSSGLTYLRARYYHPALGRFLTQDSLIPDVTNGQALNAYTYVYNDPINLVDPSGNIPSVGDTAVWAAQQAPDAWKGRIRDLAAGGLGFMDKWYSQPDDCDCRGGGTPPAITNLNRGLNQQVATPAAQLALSTGTSPAQKVATRVDQYARWPASTRFGPISVDRLSLTYKNVDITNLRLVNYKQSYTYINGSGNTSIGLRMNDGRKVIAHNIRNRWRMPGLFGSIVGAGIVDGAFQVLGDWSSGLCLSPNQMFWRFYTAFTFGLIAGIFGTVAVGIAVAAGLPVVAAGVAGWVVSSYVAKRLSGLKDFYTDVLTAAAR